MQRMVLEMRRVALILLVLHILQMETGQHHDSAIGERVLELHSVPVPTQDIMI